jgi:hypothetical protein
MLRENEGLASSLVLAISIQDRAKRAQLRSAFARILHCRNDHGDCDESGRSFVAALPVGIQRSGFAIAQ